MLFIVSILLALGFGLWFGRRFGPAVAAALVVLTLPLWLIGGAVLDLGRRAWLFVRPRRQSPPPPND